MRARELALSFLNEYESLGKYVNLSLSSHLLDSVTREERAFVTALLYTAVENKLTYDYYIASLSGRSIDKIDLNTKNILRLGFCQILNMEKIPEFAAVNETVKLARNKGERAFVNGILRAALRNKDNLPLPDKSKNTARYFSVKYSFPLWIVKKFIEILGITETERLLCSFSEIRPTDITVNTEKISLPALMKKISDEGYDVEMSEYSPISLRINSSVDPRILPGFEEGEFFVQDASCALAISLLAPESGERVVDVCACPGGKSFAALVHMKDKGEVICFDLHESKLSLITEGAKRLGFKSVTVGVRDATNPESDLFSSADRVICDVPCSGLGVLGKKPDIRYKEERDVASLPKLQLSILENSSKYLKCGGRILYSTCTLNPDENEGVVKAFLEAHSDFVPVPFFIGDREYSGGMATLYPQVHNTDGFFISIFEKKKETDC